MSYIVLPPEQQSRCRDEAAAGSLHHTDASASCL
ncbi:hypothetical protein DVU_2625 [Nitratidesulfovibrio vulgaris str. Hildenborough]|uniref:Uncharacterized protein n=1 Tax=Nitratidesulfovibrio vulgaris (strain ATCC 29579 / DSM 644 / CCUG 34227 / NCIMB 8303 / VKM B-1760 / Hildenborough) TaxID=882 RepID=Q728H8_NITV2|nr:hypothetical protein DVU_2625 [Nitratidesulfovibrio vulgaris str. Hildenborough]